MTWVSTAIACAAFATAEWCTPAPRWIWNASASAPVGLHRIEVGARPEIGDLVAILPPENVERYLAARGYLPTGIPLLKRMAAGPGARVCRSQRLVTVDGQPAAIAETRDRAGRALPVWSGCRTLRGGELFLINTAPGSLDSRYFGPFPAERLIGTAHPLLTRDASGAPLRWRRAAFDASFPARSKDMP